HGPPPRHDLVMTAQATAQATDGAAQKLDPVALVTGAGGRLGSAIAGALALRGMRLALADVSAPALERLVYELRSELSLGEGRVLGIEADVASDADVARLVRETLDVFGRLYAGVNNAGVEGPISPAEDLDLEDVLAVYQVNVFGTLRVMKAVLPTFKGQRSGRIVNVASGAGTAGTAFMAAYSSSKHAVIGLTRSIAREVADHNVLVNAVCPGSVESPMMDRIEAELGRLAGEPVSFEAAVPMGRYARPAEVAELVAYLAVDAPAYITGAALVMDGGMRA